LKGFKVGEEREGIQGRETPSLPKCGNGRIRIR
jgi:hypothetical protein